MIKKEEKPRIPYEPRVRNLCAIYISFAESTAEVLVAGEVRSTSPLLRGRPPSLST